MKSQSTLPAEKKKGRPVADGLRGHLLQHTLKVLLRDGYKKFSMNAVAQSAKASKETLYRHFGDKAGLLHAALVGNAAFIEPILHKGLEECDGAQARLFCIGMNYLHGCYLPEAMALQRIAYADGKHGLGPLFAREITERAIDFIEQEFALLGSGAARADAEVFLGMIQGKLHERILLGVELADVEQQLEQQVRHALLMLAPYLLLLDKGK